MSTFKRRMKGFTLLEIMILVVIIGMIAAIAIPNFMNGRSNSRTGRSSFCVSNLRQIQAAKAAWAEENKKVGTDTPTDADLFGADKYIKAKPTCPSGAGAGYTLNTVGGEVTCPNAATETNHVLSAAH